jgi:hypothetical protein
MINIMKLASVIAFYHRSMYVAKYIYYALCGTYVTVLQSTYCVKNQQN